MRTSSIADLKKELSNMPKADLLDICTKLIKFRKENKEMLHYLIHESGNENAYIEAIKEEIDILFEEVNVQSIFFAKKTIRKILRLINKYAKFSGLASTHIALLIHFCEGMRGLPLAWGHSKLMLNMYHSQLAKIEKLLLTLHPDLQYDYRQAIEGLELDKH